jgi:hypothetical protein
MNNRRELPKTATIPMPRPSPANNSSPGPEAYAPRGHNSFLAPMHEDVGRAMQNVIDLQNEVLQLRQERQEWERRALLAEGKVQQLGEDIIDLKEDSAKEISRMKLLHGDAIAHIQKELDYFKNRDAVVQTKLTIGAKHFLDCIQAIEDQDTVKVLSGVEEELTKFSTTADADKPPTQE